MNRGLLPPLILVAALASVFMLQHVYGKLCVPVMARNGVAVWPLGMVSASSLAAGKFSALFTHLFVHQSFTHLVFNCWPLLQFGPELVRRIGSLRFYALYLSAGVAGALCEIGMHVALGREVLLLGASGAVCGVMAAHLKFMERAEYSVLFFRRSFTGATLLRSFLIISVGWGALGLIAPEFPGSRIAHFAHAGGWLWGWWLIARKLG